MISSNSTTVPLTDVIKVLLKVPQAISVTMEEARDPNLTMPCSLPTTDKTHLNLANAVPI